MRAPRAAAPEDAASADDATVGETHAARGDRLDASGHDDRARFATQGGEQVRCRDPARLVEMQDRYRRHEPEVARPGGVEREREPVVEARAPIGFVQGCITDVDERSMQAASAPDRVALVAQRVDQRECRLHAFDAAREEASRVTAQRVDQRDGQPARPVDGLVDEGDPTAAARGLAGRGPARDAAADDQDVGVVSAHGSGGSAVSPTRRRGAEGCCSPADRGWRACHPA